MLCIYLFRFRVYKIGQGDYALSSILERQLLRTVLRHGKVGYKMEDAPVAYVVIRVFIAVKDPWSEAGETS
jgi:hypothetical protein